MEQQDSQDDLTPLADQTSAAYQRLSYLDTQGSRRLSRRAVLERMSNLGRPDFEPVVSSPLKQPSWSQESVSTPRSSPAVPGSSSSNHDCPLLDQGYDEEPVVLHPAGLERVSPEVWAGWYVEHGDGSAQSASATERSASPIQLLSESSDPDFTNTSLPFFTPQDPIGSPPRPAAAATSWSDLPPLGASADPPPTASNAYNIWGRIDAASASLERGRSLGYSIHRPASPAPGSSSEDVSWLSRLPQGSGSGEDF